MPKETLVPESQVREILGLGPVKLIKTEKVVLNKFRDGKGNVWLRRDQILAVMKMEYERTESKILGQFIRVFEEGTR